MKWGVSKQGVYCRPVSTFLKVIYLEETIAKLSRFSEYENGVTAAFGHQIKQLYTKVHITLCVPKIQIHGSNCPPQITQYCNVI